jgi:nitric oxide synthase-interacting protein
MTLHETPDPHASKEEQARSAALHGRMLCYVCETDITPRNPEQNGEKKKSKKDKEKDGGVQPGLVAVCSEGTGFAGGGGNVATKTGVAFQC